MKIYRNDASELNSYLTIDTTLPADNHLSLEKDFWILYENGIRSS